MPLGRLLITTGLIIAAIGLLITFGPRLPFRLGHLPGDISIQSRNSSFYFPLTTCLIISAVLSLVLWLFRR